MLNPWLILAAVLALVGVGAGGYYAGHSAGVNTQRVADQTQFDKINADLTTQKTAANKLLADAQTKDIANAEHNQQIAQEIEHRDENNRAKTAALQQQYSGLSLRYAAATDPRRGQGGSSPDPAASAAPSAEPGPIVQLPNSLAANLRQYATDADGLADEYRKCLDYESQVTAWVAAHSTPSNGP